MNAIIPRLKPLRQRRRSLSGTSEFAHAVFLSGDGGTAAVRGEDQRSDASGAANGAGGHDHVSQVSGGNNFLTSLNSSAGLTIEPRQENFSVNIRQQVLLVAKGPNSPF